MCIAIVKPMGVDVPDDKILETCFRNNNDGAGFAFNHNGRVVIKKGFMKFNDFIDAFNTYNHRYNFKERGVLIHFRIATHGGVNQGMTHPFPIQSDNGALQKIEYISDYAVIHNGTISLTGSTARKETNMSDTAVFIRDYLYDIARNKDWFDCSANIDLIEKLIDSKMAILNKDGRFITTSGFTEDNGILYSNTSYQDNYFRYKRTNYSNSLLPDFYDYDDYSDYYGCPDYYRYLTEDKKKENKDSNKKITNKLVPLMQLPVGYTIEDGGLSEIVKNEEGAGFFIDKDFNYYYGFLDTKNKNLSADVAPFFMDFCLAGTKVSVFDTNLNRVSFTADIEVYPDQFENFD